MKRNREEQSCLGHGSILHVLTKSLSKIEVLAVQNTDENAQIYLQLKETGIL